MKVTALMLALVAVATAANKTPSLRGAERDLQSDVDLVEYEDELNDGQDDMTPAKNAWNALDMGDMRDEDTLVLGDDDAVLNDDEMLGVILNEDGMANDDEAEAYDDDGSYGDDEYAKEDATKA
jgi:hypothetical protein